MSRQDANAIFANTSFLYGANAAYIEDLYAKYEADQAGVDAEWRAFFQSLKDEKADVVKGARGASWKKPNWPVHASDDLVAALDGQWAEAEKKIGEKISATAQAKGIALSSAVVLQATRDSIHALMLIRAYRIRGHFHAKLDPLGLEPEKNEGELDPRSYGFTEADMDRKIYLDKVLGLEFASMREIVGILRRTYCQTLGVEFMHISNAAQKSWIQERIEGRDKEITFTREGKRAILNKLVEAEGFEKFLDVKYTGTKRFGLDGAEALIPALEQIIKRGGNLGVKEIVLGMPHRGRLNVLTQVMAKSHRALFHEFKGGSANPDAVEGSGDVKYHLGAEGVRKTQSGEIAVALAANPSHLEAVNPVVEGRARAEQTDRSTRAGVHDPGVALPILIHGDAAFAGQGVVAETLAMSDITGYRVGGTSPFGTRSPLKPKNPARHSDTPKRISDQTFELPASTIAQEDSKSKRRGLLAQLSGKLHSKANRAAPTRQASRDVADESARVLKLSTQPSKSVELHAIDNQSHLVSGESPLGQVPVHKKAPAVARREPLRKRVRSLLQQMSLNRWVWPSQTAKLQLVNAAKPAVQSKTMERKPVVSALQSVESGSADANPVSPAPLRNYSRAPQMKTVPPSQRPLRTAIREKTVTERSPSKSVPATWPSLKFPAQNVSDHARIGSPNLEGKQKESAHVAESPKAHVASSIWSSAAATDDRWPDLPDHFPAKTEPALMLRTAEHQRALDLEQRGGR